jgi:HD-like signal output (HDOD) protein
MQRYPHVVRIVLSGQSDQETVLRAVGAAHQYLSKPCEAEHLIRVLSNAARLSDLISNAALRTAVSRIDTLPSPPALYTQLVEELKSEKVSLQRVGGIISGDASMSAKVLQLVNSAFFGLPRHVPDAHQAVCYLGVETIKSLVLTVQVFSQLAEEGTEELRLGWLFEHSVLTGRLARALAAAEGLPAAAQDEALMAGMTHTLGALLLATRLPEEYLKARALATRRKVPLWEAELESLGVTHAEFAGYLLGLWGLPASIVDAGSSYHRGPATADPRATSTGVPLAFWVHLADALQQEHSGSWGDFPVPTPDAEWIRHAGLESRLPAWREIAATVSISNRAA